MAQKTAHQNPMGTDGFEFVEYTAPDPQLLRNLFERLGFPVVARHRSKNVTLHSQGDINFVINAEPGSFGQRFAQAHARQNFRAVLFDQHAAAAAIAALAPLQFGINVALCADGQPCGHALDQGDQCTTV